MRLTSLWNRRSAGLAAAASAALFVAAACGGSSTAEVAATDPTATRSAPGPTQESERTVQVGTPKAVSVSVPLDFPIEVYTGEEEVGASELSFSGLFDGGKPVVLNFWAGLCPPCRAEMPDIQAVHDEFKDRVVIFGVDIGPFVGLGNKSDATQLIRDLGVTYPTGATNEPGVISTYRVLGMPTTVFLTPDGKVKRTWTGLLTEAKLVELVEELMAASGA